MCCKAFYTFTLVTALFLPYSAVAEYEYAFPKLISSDELKYPMAARRRSLEGWAYYSYLVGADGRVSDIRILDSNGIKMLNDKLIRSVESRVYEPATLGGKAIEHAVEASRATFLMSDKPRAASRKYYRRYHQAQSAIVEGKLDDAKALLQQLSQIKERNLYEELYLQSAYVAYFNSTGEAERAYAHTERVLDFYSEGSRKKRLVEEDYFVPFLANAYRYELSKMMIGDALGSASFLSRIAPENVTSMKIIKHAEQLAKKIKTKQHSMTQALTPPIYGGSQGRISLELLKSELEFSDVTGVIDTIYLRCERGMKVLRNSTEVIWLIPLSWGACSLTIYGEVGATFRLTEFPSGTLEAHRGNQDT